MAPGGCFTVHHGNERGRCATPRVLSALAGMGNRDHVTGFPGSRATGPPAPFRRRALRGPPRKPAPAARVRTPTNVVALPSKPMSYRRAGSAG